MEERMKLVEEEIKSIEEERLGRIRTKFYQSELLNEPAFVFWSESFCDRVRKMIIDARPSACHNLFSKNKDGNLTWDNIDKFHKTYIIQNIFYLNYLEHENERLNKEHDKCLKNKK